MRTGIWTFRDPRLATVDVVGFDVEAIDGSIGKVDDASNEIAASYLVVETGPWIFGKRVLLPAGIVDQIDEADGIVYVNHTKEEIKNAPEYDPDLGSDERYRTELGDYYSAQVSGGMRAASTPLE